MLPGASGRPGPPVPGLVDPQRAPPEFAPVQGLDGLGGTLGFHLHETEPPRLAGFPIGDQTDLGHFPVLAEEVFHVILGHGIRKIAQIYGFQTKLPA